MATQDLKNKTAKGLLWGGFGSVMLQFTSLVFGIILARLLNAEDYGIVGLLAIFSQLAATFCESGFTKALVNRPGLRHKDFNAVFWFSLSVGVLCYIVLFCCAPLIARFYNEPRLTALSRYAFLFVLLACLNVVPSAYMLKTLMVKQRTLSMWICLGVSNIVGVFLAFRGFAHWGIVTQNLIYSFLNVVLNYGYSKWRPSLRFSIKPLREMFSYSVKLLGTSILTIINNNLFTIFLAKFFSIRIVGNYNQANKWGTMGYSLITTPLWNVTQPVLAAIDVESERERYYAAFRKLVRFTAFVGFPVLFGLAFIAREFIVILITDKWLESAEMLSILAVGYAFYMMTRVFSDVLAERGRSDLYFWVSAASGGLQILCLFLLHPFGIRVMLLSGMGVQVLGFFLWYFFVWREVGYKLWHLVGDVFSYAGIAAIAIGVVYGLLGWTGITNIYLSIVLKVLMVAVLYIGALYFTKSVMLRESYQYLKSILRSMRGRDRKANRQ